MQVNEHDINPKEIVLEFLEALNRRDFKSARTYVSDNVSYIAPLNSFNGAEPYFKYVEHLNLPKLDIKKVFTEGSNDVSILWEVNYSISCTNICKCMVSSPRWKNKFDEAGFQSTTLPSTAKISASPIFD